VPNNLTKRGGMWRFQRRVPSHFIAVVGRDDVKISTGIRCANDPKGITASRRAEQINRDLETQWRLLADGKNVEAQKFWADAQAAARKMRISPPIDDSFQRAVDEAVRRALAPGSHTIARTSAGENRAAVAAAYDVVPKRAMTFKQAATAYIAANKDGWKNPKHRQQWTNTLETYAYPVIGDLDVAAVTSADVLRIIEPIWATKHETARRIRGRIETVLDWAKENKYRSGENPAALKGNFQHSLPASDTVHIVEHHPALPFDKIAAFMTELRGRKGVSARALEVTILTGVRTDAIIRAKWTEFDFEGRLWTVPPERAKRKAKHGSKSHVVPLTDRVIAIIQSMRPITGGGAYVFSSSKGKNPLSNMAMLNLRDAMGYGTDGKNGHITVHGFRSTFDDWISETTTHEHIVKEMALGHVIKSETEAAYRRGVLLQKRIALMADWERHCLGTAA
jgi:integrase